MGAVGTTLKLMDGFSTPMQKVFSSMDKMFETLEKINQSAGNLELNEAMSEARKAIGGANEALSQMGENLRNVDDKTNNLFSSFKRFIGISAVIEGGRRALTGMMNYDDAARQAMAIMGDGSQQMLEQMNRYSSKFATGGVTKKDIAQGYQYTSLAGWDFNESTFAMPIMRDIQRVTGENFGLISDLITDSMTPLGLVVAQLPQFADQMAVTQNISNTNMKQLLEAYQSGGFKGVQTGKMSIPELNAFIGVLGNAGIKGAEAGTQVRNIMNGLYDTSSKTNDILEKMQVSAYENGAARNAFDVLQEFGAKLSTYDDQTKKGIMSGMFNVYDEIGLNALMLQLDQMATYRGQIEDSSGALNNMIQIMDGGIGGAFRSFLSQFNIWMSGLGTALEPLGMVLFSFLQSDFAGTLFTTLQVLAGGVSGLAMVLLMLFAVVDPLTPLIWGLIGAMGLLYAWKSLETLQTKFQASQTQLLVAAKFAEIAAQKGKLSAILMTIPVLVKESLVNMWRIAPILAVIGAIGLVTIVLVALSQKFDGVRVTMVRFINGLIGAVNWLLEQMSKIPVIGEKFSNIRIPKLDLETGLKFNNPFKAMMPEMPNLDNLTDKMPDMTMPARFDVGNVDRVGKIDGEVSISDEDIKLMRDVAMKEALVQYNTFKVEQSNSFGDIRETADADGVIERLERMLDEEIAVSTDLRYKV